METGPGRGNKNHGGYAAMIKSCVTISLVPSLAGGPWIYWDELEISIAKAANLGFDAVELFTASPDAVDLDELFALLEKYEITLAAVGTGAGKVLKGLSLTSSEKKIRHKACEFITEMIAFGAHFGAPAIIGSMQGNVEKGIERAQAIQWLTEGLRELGQKAADLGVDLIFEPLNRYETNMINTLGDGVNLLESQKIDNVYLLADLFHMNIEERSIPDSICQAGDHIGHLHFADSNRRPAGMGHIDYHPIAEALSQIRFNGYASAEAFAYPDPDTAAAATIKAYKEFFTQ
jgi:sugar phosphate isomerase/epimerase